MSRRRVKAPNQCVDHDVNLPLSRAPAQVPTCAADLTDNQIAFLAEYAARQGNTREPADYCRTAFGFEPTAEDRAGIAWAVSLHPEWADHLELARIGWDAWFKKRYAPVGAGA